MKRAALIAVALLLSVACNSGSGEDTTNTPRPQTEPTPAVDRADEGKVNRPEEGQYEYEYRSEVNDPSKPESTPVVSRAGARLHSAVSYEDDVVVTAEKTTQGPAVTTSKRRYEDDKIVEVSFETKAGPTTRSCTYGEPIVLVEIPVKEGELDEQELAGEGNACGGDRTVTIEGKEDVADAVGVDWSTWRIETVTTTELQTVTETRWFSVDLGKDVRARRIVELKNTGGTVTMRAEENSLLESHPT